MDRMRRLTSLWSWLPTFRAVAEHEHLSRAAEDLGVSASAVSRMIGLLEDDVGVALFERVGRGIRLTEGGRHLLHGVRSAMRMVDESLALIHDEQLAGDVRIASDDLVARLYLLPAMTALRAQHPKLSPRLRSLGEAIDARLLAGAIDVALLWYPSDREQLRVEPLGELRFSVYAGALHPLAGRRRRLRPRDLTDHPFVLYGPEPEPGGPWPLGYRRVSPLTVETPWLAAEACASGELLSVLPDVVVDHPTTQHLGLLRLPVDGLAPRTLHAQWRAPLELKGRAEAVVEAVRAQIASAP